MNSVESSAIASVEAEEQARRLGVSIEGDVQKILDVDPGMEAEEIYADILLDDFGKAGEAVHGLGTDYDLYQLSYWVDNEQVARRMIAAIPPGRRTELAYWHANAPEKQLDIHRGLGSLLWAASGAKEELHEERLAEPELLGVAESDSAVLPPDTFYTFLADADMPNPLIVSGFYIPPVASWQDFETEVYPGDHLIEAEDDHIHVPTAFWDHFKYHKP